MFMALQKSVSTGFGFDCPKAYIMITSSNFDYLNKRAWLNVATYISDEARISLANPIRAVEHYIYNGNGNEGIKSKYQVDLISSVSGSGDTLVLDLFGDTKEVITLVEGVDFEGYIEEEVVEGEGDGDSTLEEGLEGEVLVGEDVGNSELELGRIDILSTSIANVLNNNNTFNKYFTVGVYVNGLIIESKVSGVSYNNLSVSGDIVRVVSLLNMGVDSVIGDFDKYFSEEAMTVEGASERSNAYVYLKTLEEYRECIDV